MRDDANELYREMLSLPWSKGDGEAGIHYGSSYTQGPSGQRGEIPTIPDFLKELAERVAENKHV
jgi:hypothetical protein